MYELTRSGVCYDLNETPYYERHAGITFYFSSMTHLRRFSSELEKKVAWITDGLERRFHCKLDMRELAAVHWYRQVETRGFHICYDEVDVYLIEDVKFEVTIL